MMFTSSAKRLVIIVAMGVLGAWPAVAFATALDDYVAAPDPSYSYSISSTQHQTFNGVGYTTLKIRMYSQTWRTAADLDRPLWQHWLTVGIPDTPLVDTAMLVINGGRTNDPPLDLEPYLGMVMAATQSVLAFLEQVPNEPLKFTDEPDPRYKVSGRTEDEIIAYSYDKFLRTGDGTWPVLLPMVKSAVRAMDTVTAVAAGRGVAVSQFVVGGGSKRGWTTWLTAAVDPRVTACVPIVIDVLNMAPQMDHHLKAYGTYSSAIQDYVDLHVFDRVDTPEGRALLQIVDPYEYRDRLTMPKNIVNASGDEFFLCDSSHFYYGDLPGEKHLRYVPNTGHGVDADMSSILAILQFYLSIIHDQPRPQFSWTVEGDGSIRVETVDTPIAVKLWQATNAAARDFRWNNGAGPHWASAPLMEQEPGTGVFVAHVPPPPSGWTGYFAELTFSDGSIYSTEVRVTPAYLPYDDLDNDGVLNRNDPDGDGDGIADAQDPFSWDTDNDNSPNEFDPDDDGDTFSDVMETAWGTNPVDAGSAPLTLIGVPAGTFTMGRRSQGDDQAYGDPDELPAHAVTLGAFQIGKYDVTNAQCAALLNWALGKGYLKDSAGNVWAGTGDVYAGGPPVQLVLRLSDSSCNLQYTEGAFSVKTRAGLPDATTYSMGDHPVVNVSWYGAACCCNWLSEWAGIAPRYDLATWSLTNPPPAPGGYRLPTEAEWERAAAWDGNKHWTYGFTSDALAAKDRCNYLDDNPDYVNPLGLSDYPYTSPVGWFDGVHVSPNGDIATANSVSPMGCCDMSGNVSQWVQDWYSSMYYAEGGPVWDNPTGPASGLSRVLRGGGWGDRKANCRTAARLNAAPENASGDVGFRVARSLDSVVADVPAARSFWYYKYASPGTLDVTVTIHNDGGPITHLALEEAIPPGWAFDGVVSPNPPGTVPDASATETLRFDWGASVPEFPILLTYRLTIPAGQTTPVVFAGETMVYRGGPELRTTIETLSVVSPRTYHASDYNPADYRIALTELLRLIQFYNTAGYRADTGTSDGYAPGAGSQDGTPHDSDYNPRNWKIDLPELLRLIQFYNSGGYHAQEGTADGFAPGTQKLSQNPVETWCSRVERAAFRVLGVSEIASLRSQ